MEALIACGIMGLIALGFATVMVNQAKEMQAIGEKLELQNLEANIKNLFSVTSYCDCFIGNNTFNYSSKTWNGFPTAVSSAYNNACGAIGPALFTVGHKIESTQLRPVSMNFTAITEVIAGSGNFSANLDIQFDQTLMALSRHNLTVPVTFSVNMSDPVATRSLNSCSIVTPVAIAALPGSICGRTSSGGPLGGTNVLCDGHNPASSCPSGYTSVQDCFNDDFNHQYCGLITWYCVKN